MPGFNFDKNENEGIFAKDEDLAAGDPKAAADIDQANQVPIVSFIDAEDGLPIPDFGDDESILTDAPPVNFHNFLCLAGPCKHYTENLKKIPEGPQEDAEEMIEHGRWCGALRTWAEQTDLTELEIYGCSAYEPLVNANSTEDLLLLKEMTNKSLTELFTVRNRAAKLKFDYGICVYGPCEHFFELIAKKPNEESKQSYRFCTRLAGLGRLYDLTEHPVVSCSAWRPQSTSENLSNVAVRNMNALNFYRKKIAQRNGEEQ